jgi:hypothetical protein
MKKKYNVFSHPFLNSSDNLAELSNAYKDEIPSKRVIQNIINYSKSLSVINLKNIGKIGLIIN